MGGVIAHDSLHHVLGFGLGGLIQVCAFAADRAGCADRRLGSHRSRMSSQGDDCPGAASHSVGWRDVHHHRNAATPDGGYHAVHDIQRPTGGIQLQDDHLSLAPRRSLQAPLQVLRISRADRTFQGNNRGFSGGRLGQC